MQENTLDQIAETYQEMAEVAHYRPAAPSDGFGNVTVPTEELNLSKEAASYAESWDQEEDTQTFFIGSCNYATRPATIYAIEAARNLCGAQDDVALELLKMAVKSLETQSAAK